MKSLLAFIIMSLMAVAGMKAGALEEMSGEKLVSLGKHYLDAEHRDSAMLCFSEVVQRYYKNPKDKGQHLPTVEAMRALGSIYLTLDLDYGKAYEYTATAMAIAEEDTLVNQLPYIYLSMACIWDTSTHVMRSNNDKTAHFLKTAYDVAAKSDMEEVLPMVAIDMAVVNMTRGREHFASELADFQKRPISSSVPFLEYSRLFVGAVQAKLQKNYAKAEALSHLAAKAVGSDLKDVRSRITAENMASDARAQSGDLAGARSLLLANLAYAKAHRGAEDYLEGINNRLARNYEEAGMADSAKIYDYEYLREKEQMFTRNVPDMRELSFLNQIDRVNGELRQMSLKKQEQERRLLWSMCVGAVMIIIAGGAILAWYWQRRHSRQLFLQNVRLLETEDQRRVERETPKAKYGSLAMEESVTDDIYRNVTEVMETSEEIYQPGYTLARLSEQTGFKSYLVSQAINEKSNGSFSQLLSARRVREASRRLASREYDNMTIEAIASTVGMQSRSSFTRIFKSITGLTPAEFRRQAQTLRNRG